jgi:hypothetical protein
LKKARLVTVIQPCFNTGVTVPGCIGADVDFDGTSYQTDWPDGTTNNAPSVLIQSVLGGTMGPRSANPGKGKYTQPYSEIQLETDVLASESTCTPTGAGCTVPPPGAAFYPFYAVSTDTRGRCLLEFGNFTGTGINNFGGDAQYGPPNLPWFFGTASSGILPNPCVD